MASDGTLEALIVERQLTLVTDEGEVREIVVRIGKPEPSPDRDCFSCEFQISCLGDGEAKRIYGVDAFQALQLTLRFISTMLNHYREEAKGRIYWQEPGDDMGFAAPVSVVSGNRARAPIPRRSPAARRGVV
jgi:hypothetical protein